MKEKEKEEGRWQKVSFETGIERVLIRATGV